MRTLGRNDAPRTCIGIAVLIVIIGATMSAPSSAQVWESDKWMHMRTIVPRGYVCHYTETPLVIDGKLDDLSWRTAANTEYFIDIEGDVKTRPWLRTQAKMLWDDTYFYVGADLQEPHVWGTLTEHDSVIFQDNDFEIFIDPNSDNHEYYEIEINALNTEWDLFLKKPYKDVQNAADNGWEIPGLKTAVHVYGTLNDPSDIDRGWSVEFAIPWTVLREYAHKAAPPEEGDQWRVNFSRVEWRHEVTDGKYGKVKGFREDNWVWSPQGIINMHCPEKWGYVQFTKEKPGTVEFRPDPTEPARNILHGIYWSQRDYFALNKRYAPSVEDLGLNFGTHPSIITAPAIELTADGYRAFCTVIVPGGIPVVVSIHQDSKVEVK